MQYNSGAMKACDMETAAQQIWTLQQYGLLMPGKLSLQIFFALKNSPCFTYNLFCRLQNAHFCVTRVGMAGGCPP